MGLGPYDSNANVNMASSQDAWYLSLLGLAENFRTSSPPIIKLCIQCLQAVFNFKPPPRVEARTHLQLGNILLTHTKNIDLARSHLEQAWLLSQSINTFDDVKFEAASVLAELYEKQTQLTLSKPILRKAIELSQHSAYWHCRLIFQLAQIHASERDYEVASSLLGVGVDYAHISSAAYTRVLFLLSRGMLLLIDKKFQEVHPLLNQAGHLIDGWQGSQHQKEYLKVFFLVLQVCHYLMAGQVKSVKPCLKQLQQSIQTIMQPTWPSDEMANASNAGDMFIWMPKEHLYVLVYLVTVMHSMQAGYMEKAQKYTDKALVQIEKLKIVDNKPILSVFQLMLLEHIIMCRLVMGNKSMALQEISQALGLCRQQPRLLLVHRPQIHTLLGLYAMSMNCMEAAEAQFMAALRTSRERELWTFANLNLAIVYLRAKREQELAVLLERINPESLPSHSHSLRAAAYYVQGLQSFFQARYNEAKCYLRETLKMANAEDLNRLTSCALVLLGHIFLSLGNSRESMNMVTPAMQLASKIPDVHVQLWASAILKDLYCLCGDPVRENEAFQMHCNFSQMLLNDHFQSSQMAEHNLILWTEGRFPMLTGNSSAGSFNILSGNPPNMDNCTVRSRNPPPIPIDNHQDIDCFPPMPVTNPPNTSSFTMQISNIPTMGSFPLPVGNTPSTSSHSLPVGNTPSTSSFPLPVGNTSSMSNFSLPASNLNSTGTFPLQAGNPSNTSSFPILTGNPPNAGSFSITSNPPSAGSFPMQMGNPPSTSRPLL